MKISKKYNLIVSCLVAILSIGISIDGKAQCGAEAITVTPWCENTYAKWEFTSPTPNAQYAWYSYVGGTPGYDITGKLVKNGASTIAPIDSTLLSTYYSPFRVTTLGIAPSTSVDFTYQKKVSYSKINPYPVVNPTFSNGAAGSTFSMNFNATLTGATALRFNYVTVPVSLTGPIGTQYKIQVMFGATGSAIYTFTSVGAKNIGGNNYLVKVPVDFTFTTGGAKTISINTNITGGVGANVNGLLYTSTQAPLFSSPTNPISIAAASAFAGSGGFSQIYDWDYSIICTAKAAGPASKQTNAALCCMPPTSLGSLSLNSDKALIVNGGTTNALLSTGSGNSANYFGWYLNGVLQGFSDIGVLSHSTNLSGSWEVKEVKNKSDLNNPSCVSSASVTIQDKKIFITNTKKPAGATLCIGDQWSFTGAGSSSLTWSSGKPKTLSNATGITTTYTAKAIGTDIVTLTGNVPSDDKVVDGSFETYITGDPLSNGASTQFSLTTNNPADVDGVYSFGTSSFQGNWGNSDWSYSGKRPPVLGNPNKFILFNNSTDPSKIKTLVWGKSVNVQPSQKYNFSFDMTSLTYFISKEQVNNDYGLATLDPNGDFLDVLLDVYINGVKVGQASTDFANNGGLDAVGKWKNYSYPWTAGAGVNQAVLELRFVSPKINDGRGYDFGLDNILLAGNEVQKDTYTVGPITDCSTISAAHSPCQNDIYSTLTATLTGGLIFDHWEKTSNPGSSVGTTNPLQVSSLTATEYEAFGFLAIDNVLDNGSFEAAGATGFLHESPYFKYVGTLNSGTNEGTVTNDTKGNNGSWDKLTPHVGSTGTLMYVADSKGPQNSKIIGWTFTATAGTKYSFSGWIANQHHAFSPTGNLGTEVAAYVGVAITAGVPNAGVDPELTSIQTPKTQAWNQMTGVWTAPSAGTYTIYVYEKNTTALANGFGNDFVLDDFVLAPSIGFTKSAKTTTPSCNPCLLNLPTLAEHTYCATTGKVSLTPSPLDPAGVSFDWYDKITGGTKLGNSVGKDTLTFTTTTPIMNAIVADSVYYTKAAKGSGIVYPKLATCNMDNNGWIDVYNINSNQIVQKYHAYNSIDVTNLTVRSELFVDQVGCSVSGNVTFKVIPTTAGGTPDNAATPYGTLTANYSRTRLASEPQKMIGEIVLSGLANIPQGKDFFIVPFSATQTNGGTNSVDINQGCNNGAIKLNEGSENTCEPLFPVIDTYNGTTVSRTGSYSSSGNSPKGGFSYNIKFNIPAYPCPRVGVKLVAKCPCSVPVSITAKSKGNGKVIDTICVGSKFAIQIDKIDTTGKTSKKGYYYYWAFTKTYNATTKAGTGYSVLTVPKKLGPTNPDYSDFAKATSVAADSGFYFLVIQDGPGVASPSCKDSAVVRLRINKAPSKALIGKDQEICYNTSPADLVQTKASATASYSEPVMYTWFSSSDSITKSKEVKSTLKKVGLVIAPTKLIANTYYVRQDSVSYCPMVRTNFVKIRVDNKPLKTNAKIVPAVRATLCEGEDFNLSATLIDSSGVNASLNGGYYFTWKHYNTAGVLIPADTKGPLPYKDFLATTRKSVASDAGTYRLVFQDGPTVAGLPNCKDSIELKVVIQKPYTAAAIIQSSDTICSGSKPTAFTEKTAPTGAVAPYKYQWYSSTDSFKVAGNTTKITSGTLIGYTESNNLTADKYYVRIDSSGYCSDTTNILKISVRPVMTAGTIGTDTAICQGGGLDLKAKMPDVTGGEKKYTYEWWISSDLAAIPAANTYTQIALAKDSFYLVNNSPLAAGVYHIKRRVLSNNNICPFKDTAPVKVTIKSGVAQVYGTDVEVKVCYDQTVPKFSPAKAGVSTETIKYQWFLLNKSANTQTALNATPDAANFEYTMPFKPTQDTFYVRLAIRTPVTSTCDTSYYPVHVIVNKKLLAGNIRQDTTICKGGTVSLTNLVAASGGGGTAYKYAWKQSKTRSGVYTDVDVPKIVGPTDKESVVIKDVSDTTWYYREVTEATCGTVGVRTDTIKVSVYNLKPGKIAKDTTICIAGTISLKEVTAPTGGKTSYTFEWEMATSTAVTFKKVSGADAFYTFDNSSATTKLVAGTYFFRRKVSDKSICDATYSDTIKVKVTQGLSQSANVDGDTLKLCSGARPLLTAPDADDTKATQPGTLKYQWQVRNGVQGVGVFVNIAAPEGTAASYQVPLPALKSDTMYRRIATAGTSKCDSAIVNFYIKVGKELFAGNIRQDTTICSGGTVSLINVAKASGGGSTNYMYVWKQSKTRDGVYKPVDASKVVGPTDKESIVIKDVSDTTWYYREATEATCGTVGVQTDTIQVSIYNLNPGKIGTDTTICLAGTISLTELAAPKNGKGTYAFEWEIATSTAVTFSKVTGTDAFYTFNNTTATTKLTSGTYFFRRKVSDASGCAVKYTDTVTVKITEAVKPAATISTPFNKLCDNFLPITFTAVPTGDLAPTYQWYILPKGSVIGNPVGTNSPTFKTTNTENVADGDSVYVKVTSSIPCASPKDSISSKIGLTIKPAVAPEMLSKDTSICESKTITFSAKGSVAADMQWFFNGDTIIGATGPDYIAEKAGTYKVIENNGICESPTTEVKLGIIPTPIANAGPDQTLQEGVISNLTGSGGETYLWSPATYLSSTTVSDPTFKATTTIPYTLVVKTGDCISDPKVVTIFVVRPITVPNVITVNGDGVNDTWEIENIEGFPNVIIEIYNRWGNLVWKTEGYPKNWDGTSFRNGEVLPDGTYFYIINLKSDVYPEPKTGWVQIMK